LNCHNPTTQIISSFIGYSPAPRVGNSDLAEDELEVIIQVIKKGSDGSRIAEAARLHRSIRYSDPSEAENWFEDCKSVHRMGRGIADITKLKYEHSMMFRIIPRVEEKDLIQSRHPVQIDNNRNNPMVIRLERSREKI